MWHIAGTPCLKILHSRWGPGTSKWVVIQQSSGRTSRAMTSPVLLQAQMLLCGSFWHGCNFFLSTAGCSKYAASCQESHPSGKSLWHQVARYVALALLPLTKKSNRLLEIYKDDNYSWLFDRAVLPMVRNAVASSAKYFSFPKTIASVLLSVNFSQLTFMNLLISARCSGLHYQQWEWKRCMAEGTCMLLTF